MKDREMEKEYHYNLHIGSHKKIDEYLITEVLTFREIELLSEYYPQLNPEEDKYNSNLENIYFFYFNHKLGDLHSTLTLLYMGVIANSFNQKQLIIRREFLYKMMRNDMEKADEKLREEMERRFKLQIIPLIKNCNYVYKYSNIDTKNPICPPPI
jgi:hypothetical protein